jgi:hypothetical protein
MNATAFDTLRFANRLTAAGMAQSQAACIAETLADTMIVDPATRSDLARLETALRGEIGSVRSEIGSVRSEIGTLRGEIGTLRGEIGTLRAETHAAIANAKVELLRWIVPLILAQMAMTFGLFVKLGW